MKIFIIAISLVLSIPSMSSAEPTINQSFELQNFEDFKFDNNASDLMGLKKPYGYRLFVIPKNIKLDEKGRKGLKALLKSCTDCQEVPQIDNGPIPSVTPKPTGSPIEICKKYPGKFGCPK